MIYIQSLQVVISQQWVTTLTSSATINALCSNTVDASYM